MKVGTFPADMESVVPAASSVKSLLRKRLEVKTDGRLTAK